MEQAAADRKAWRTKKAWRQTEVQDEDGEFLTPLEDEASR